MFASVSGPSDRPGILFCLASTGSPPLKIPSRALATGSMEIGFEGDCWSGGEVVSSVPVRKLGLAFEVAVA